MLKKIYLNRYSIYFFKVIIKINFLFVLKVYCKYLILKRAFCKIKTETNFISVINTHDQSGGASTIAYELCENLKEKKNIHFYVKYKKRSKDWIKEIYERKNIFLENLLIEEAKRKGWINFAGFDSINLLDDLHFNKSKIVHLHNLHENYLSPAIFSVLFKNKEIIWTLHDEYINTGHCGFSMKCNNWVNGCGNCPDLTIYPSVTFDNTKKVLKNKIKWINDIQPYIITPSNWLEKRVRTVYPKLKNIKTIHNGIDTKTFFPKNKVESKKKISLPIDKILVLFVAEFATKNPFKGGNIFREIIEKNTNKEIVFISVGNKIEHTLKNHISIPYITAKEELAILYNACDVLLYPTQADNFPLVVLESMACGTPVITSKLGGIPEIITNEEDGFLVTNYHTKDEFLEILNTYVGFTTIKKSSLGANASKKITTHFSLDKMNESYLNLYNEVLNTNE